MGAKLSWIGQDVSRVGAAPQGEHMRVFQQQQLFCALASANQIHGLVLQSKPFGVAYGSEHYRGHASAPFEGPGSGFRVPGFGFRVQGLWPNTTKVHLSSSLRIAYRVNREQVR